MWACGDEGGMEIKGTKRYMSPMADGVGRNVGNNHARSSIVVFFSAPTERDEDIRCRVGLEPGFFERKSAGKDSAGKNHARKLPALKKSNNPANNGFFMTDDVN